MKARRKSQSLLRPGDFFRLVLSVPTHRKTIRDELVVVGELLHPLAGCHPSEREYLAKLYAETPHLRWARSYSEVCPDGEFGDVDVRFVEQISKDAFDAERERHRKVAPTRKK